MSSRELLEILDGLPEISRYKEAAERSVRVVRYTGNKPELRDDNGRGKLLRVSGIGPPATDVEVLAEFIDWTHDKKIQARIVREIASLRADPDFTGVMEPLHAVLAHIHAQEMQQLDERFDAHLMSGLHGYERR
jgi:hypothetical protein